jgi:two-component system OmpR family sensor kinase
MSTFTNADEPGHQYRPTAVVGRTALVGVLAGLVFGAGMQFVMGRMTAIGAMYTLGDPSLTVGWVAHLFHSALFGAFFGLVADTRRINRYATQLAPSVGLGALYATGLWFVNVVFVWPLWLNSVTFGAQIPLPNLAVMPLVGHLVWGVLLGAGTAIALSQ